MEKDVLKELEQNRIIAIMRHVSLDKVVPVAKALYDGGIRLLEITFQQGEDHCEEETAQAILKVKSALGEKMLVGAGTVMTVSYTHLESVGGIILVCQRKGKVRKLVQTKKQGNLLMELIDCCIILYFYDFPVTLIITKAYSKTTNCLCMFFRLL